MASLFISYSRKDIDAARKLTEAFKGQDLDFWIDWEGIAPTVDWWKEIEKGIEEADIFLFLLSPDSAVSRVCKQEIEHAVQNGKRLIPVVVRDVKSDESPAELGHLNWIFLRDGDDFGITFNKLITAINTDYEWVQAHRQLQVKALEWERTNHENSFLLRGRELQDAEFQLVTNAAKEPNLTALQREYVLKSRQASDRQRRLVTGIAIVLAVVMGGLGLFGLDRARLATANAIKEQAASTLAVSNEQVALTNEAEAKRQAKVALSRQLAAQSVSLREKDFQLSMLLGIQAYDTDANPQTWGVLFENVQSNPQLLFYLDGVNNAVSKVAFSPDGKILAAGTCVERAQDLNYDFFVCVRGEIGFWDVETWQPVRESLRGQTSLITDLAFSPDGKTLASSGNDGTILLWDMETSEPFGELKNERVFRTTSLSFSPDGKRLAASAASTADGGDDLILLWDVQTLSPIGEPLVGHTGWVMSVAFSPDGKTLASASYDGTILLWNAETGQLIGSAFQGHTDPVLSVAFSPDGRTLVSSADDGTILFWDAETHQPLGDPITGPASSNVVFSPHGKILLSSGSDGTIMLWDVETRRSKAELRLGHTAAVANAAFSPDGTMFASAGTDGMILLWEAESPPPLSEPLVVDTDAASLAAFSPDGKTIAAGFCNKWVNDPDAESPQCVEGDILLWDRKSHQRVGEPFVGHTGAVWSLAFSPDGTTLASGDENGTILFWDVKNRQPINELVAVHEYGVWRLVFSPDGKTLTSQGLEDTMIVWDVETFQQIRSGPMHVRGAMSSDGKLLAVLSGRQREGNSIGIVDLAADRLIRQLQYTNTILTVAFSPDGKLLASASSDGAVNLWNIETGRIMEPPMIVERVDNLAFSPDGRILAAGGLRRIVLWDVETHQPIGQPMPVNGDWIKGLVFSSDGTSLISTVPDAEITLWNLDPQGWIEVICRQIRRNLTHAEWTQYLPDQSYPAGQEDAACPNLPLEQEVTP